MRKIIVFLQNTLGVFGSILYMLPAIYIIAGAAPMMGLPRFVGFISIIIAFSFPPLVLPLWIGGLIGAIKGEQDIAAILYYISSGLVFLPLIYAGVSDLINKRRN